MRKLLPLALLFALSANASAGQIVYKNMYVTNTIVQGVGVTEEVAIQDALSAIPAGYVRDPANGPMFECTVSEEMLRATNGDRCDTAIRGNLYRLSIPIVERSL